MAAGVAWEGISKTAPIEGFGCTIRVGQDAKKEILASSKRDGIGDSAGITSITFVSSRQRRFNA